MGPQARLSYQKYLLSLIPQEGFKKESLWDLENGQSKEFQFHKLLTSKIVSTGALGFKGVSGSFVSNNCWASILRRKPYASCCLIHLSRFSGYKGCIITWGVWQCLQKTKILALPSVGPWASHHHRSTEWELKGTSEVIQFNLFILQRRKLRPRRQKWLALNHRDLVFELGASSLNLFPPDPTLSGSQ